MSVPQVWSDGEVTTTNATRIEGWSMLKLGKPRYWEGSESTPVYTSLKEGQSKLQLGAALGAAGAARLAGLLSKEERPLLTSLDLR